MRLPNFLNHEGLTELKAKMGIAPNIYGQGQGHHVKATLTDQEREKLISGDGIDVTRDDLIILQNGTIVYKGVRVLLYIRDVIVLGDRQAEPRYHLATCRTIEMMHGVDRMNRYVVAQQPNGLFRVNVTSHNRTRSEIRRLSVCQNCLAKLSFAGFHYGMDQGERKLAVEKFTPEEFFSVYPQSPHTKFPSFDEYGAPLNDYSRDFPSISSALRESRGWKCERCQRAFADPRFRRYLHVHHRNGERWDNSPENLGVLCVGCHSDMPGHSHMKGLPIYRQFLRHFPLVTRPTITDDDGSPPRGSE